MKGGSIVTCRGRASRSPDVLRNRLDEAEDVVPAAAVEAGGVVAQLIEDLVHLEGGEASSRSAPSPLIVPRGRPRAFLRGDEDVVPQAGLQMVLDFG